LVYADVYDIFGKENNLGVFLNFNVTVEDLTVWNTQNRFLDQTNRLPGSVDPDDPDFNPESAAIANAAILGVNPDADTPIWDRFDPDERRADREDYAFNASFDYKLSDRTKLYFRPWVRYAEEDSDLMAFRVDRLEREFEGNFFFLDDAGNPLGEFEDTDGDGTLGSEGDTFIQATDENGDIIVTRNFEANGGGNTRNDRILQNNQEESLVYTLDLGGETELSNGVLDYRVLYSVDETDDFRMEGRWQERAGDGPRGELSGKGFLRARVFGDTPFPTFNLFEVTEDEGHVPVNSREENVFGDLNRLGAEVTPRFLFNDLRTEVLLSELNYEHHLNNELTLKTGLRYRREQRTNQTTQLFFGPSAGNRRAFPLGQFSDVASKGPSTVFSGRFADDFGPFMRMDPIVDAFFDDLLANPENWEFVRTDLRDAIDTADLTEEILGAYIQGTLHLNDLTVVGGVRFEQTWLDTTWTPSQFFVDGRNLPGLTDEEKSALNDLVQIGVEELGFVGPPGSFNFGDIVTDINETNKYSNVLPSAVLTYRPGNTGHVFRAAWTNTLTRPNPRELIPFDLGQANQQLQEAGVLNLTNRDDEFDIGNPDLTEQTSLNFDFAYEYYFGPQRRNQIILNWFYKDLDDFLLQNSFDREVEVLIEPGNPAAGTEFVEEGTRFITNASSRSIQGLEVSGNFAMEDWLPEWLSVLDGLRFIPNYTFITGSQLDPVFDSEALAENRIVIIDEEESDSLTNQAKHILNLQFFYEIQRWDFRLSFNWISELQRTPSTAAIEDTTFDASQGRLNLSVQYQLFKDRNVRLFLEADNLDNEPQDERFVGSQAGLFTTSFEETGRRFVFGIRGSF